MCHYCQGINRYKCQRCGHGICRTHRNYTVFADWESGPVLCPNCAELYRGKVASVLRQRQED